jgi:myo-inositol-1(or 4)-monophosphatase
MTTQGKPSQPKILSSTTVTADFGPEQPFLPYLLAAFEACDGASVILKHHYGNLKTIDEKFQAGLVSEADRNSEKFIVDLLRNRFPDHAFLGEEAGLQASQNELSNNSLGQPIDQAQAQGSGQFPDQVRNFIPSDDSSKSRPLWMIDPLDGTTNYIHQFPFFCISIGLEIDGRIRAAVVVAPELGLRFYALEGGGAYLNGTRIHVSSRQEFKDGLFATGFSSHDDTLDVQLRLLTKIIREARGIRRAGAAALDLCFVAQGVFDVYWERNLQTWDTAAGMLIAQEAGGVVTDMNGGEFNPRLKSILCGNPYLHKEILNCLRGGCRD